MLVMWVVPPSRHISRESGCVKPVRIGTIMVLLRRVFGGGLDSCVMPLVRGHVVAAEPRIGMR